MVMTVGSTARKFTDMTAQRLLSPFETSYFSTEARLGSVPIGGMPLYIGSTVRGRIDAEILRRVLAELAAGHPLLRSSIVETDGVLSFRCVDTHRPVLEIADGGAAEYLELVNSQQDWRAGLFRARLLRDGDLTRIVLIIHHGIADGRSAFALLDEMWQRYTGHIVGSPLPQVNSTLLPDGVDNLLAAVTAEAEVDEFLAGIRAAVLAADPADAPRMLPKDGDGVGDPRGRLALQRIELTEDETGALVNTARTHGLSVNSLLSGAAMAAVRAQLEPGTGPLPLLCGHAVDLRYELVPRLSASTMLNCASGVGTPVVADEDADPIALARAVADGMRLALDTRFAALFMRANQRELDELTAAVFAAGPTLALSNVGRLPAHSLPAGIDVIRDDVFAMMPGMPPKMTIFTVGARLIIQVEYDTAEHTHAQMGRLTRATAEQIRLVTRGVVGVE